MFWVLLLSFLLNFFLRVALEKRIESVTLRVLDDKEVALKDKTAAKCGKFSLLQNSP